MNDLHTQSMVDCWCSAYPDVHYVYTCIVQRTFTVYVHVHAWFLYTRYGGLLVFSLPWRIIWAWFVLPCCDDEWLGKPCQEQSPIPSSDTPRLSVNVSGERGREREGERERERERRIWVHRSMFEWVSACVCACVCACVHAFVGNCLAT